MGDELKERIKEVLEKHNDTEHPGEEYFAIYSATDELNDRLSLDEERIAAIISAMVVADCPSKDIAKAIASAGVIRIKNK